MTNQHDKIHTNRTPAPDELRIRLLGADDTAAVAALAGRDTADIPTGTLLGAELGGRLIAAMPLEGDARDAIADPFSPSADAVAMLETRVHQLRGTRRRRLSLAAFVPRAHASLPRSPSGAGGRIL